jgi:hypothetical protein
VSKGNQSLYYDGGRIIYEKISYSKFNDLSTVSVDNGVVNSVKSRGELGIKLD